MGRPKGSTNSAAKTAAVEETMAAVIDEVVEKEEVVEQTVTTVKNDMEEVKETKVKIAEPLMDSDEIEVISLVPHVSYKDSHTGDFYEWDETDHVEYMAFSTLKNMWRNNKTYFKNMWLKPKDDRVVDKFGLASTYKKYDFLMDKANYKRDNIDELCQIISEAPNGLKNSLYTKIKNLVIDGEVTDAVVIRAIEKHLKVDLISFL